MYEEGNTKLNINWLSLAIKLVILAVIVFILCWLFTKNANKDTKTVENDTDYINNITAMKESAFEYFTESNLPTTVGGTEKLTLSQMLNQKLLIDFTDDGDKCDTANSYVQATKTADGAYALKVSLNCGEKKDFIVTTIEKQKCTVNCNNIINNNSSKEDNSSSTNSTSKPVQSSSSTKTNASSNKTSSSTSTVKRSNSSSSTKTKTNTTVKTTVKVTVSCTTCSSNTSKPAKPTKPAKPVEQEKPTKPTTPTKPATKTTYYKYVKYGDWKSGYSNKDEAENKKFTETTYNYCKERTNTVYTTSYIINSKSQSYSYTLKFKEFNAKNVVDETIYISNKSYFTKLQDYEDYIDYREDQVTMVDRNSIFNSPIFSKYDFRDASLDSSNFTYTIGNVYKSGNYYYVDVDIRVKNTSGVTPFFDPNLNTKVYYIPLKFNINYSLNKDCVRDTKENSSKYKGYTRLDKDTDSYWMHRLPEYKWSTEKSLSGWTYTGISEER